MSDGADRSGDRALAGELRDRVAAFLRRHDPPGDRLDFLRARFDAGPAWVARAWRERPELRTPGGHDEVLRLWVRAEAARLTAARLSQQFAAGEPGPERSAVKLSFAGLSQGISGAEVELLGEEGLRHDEWTMRRPPVADFLRRTATHRYLRARGNSIAPGWRWCRNGPD